MVPTGNHPLLIRKDPQYHDPRRYDDETRYFSWSPGYRLSFLAAQSASAQWSLGIGAGATIPTGDFSDFGDGDGASTGWAVNANLSRALNSNVSVLGAGSYGSNGHETEGDKTNVIRVGGALLHGFGDGDGAAPFVFGGGGVLGHQFSPDVGDGETDWQGYVIGGAGLGFPLGDLLGFVTGSYVHGFNETTYFGVGAGISIPLGGDDM